MRILDGKINLSKKGFGFFIPDDENLEHIFISRLSLNRALDNDRVRIKVIKEAEGNNKAEGEVVEILERNRSVLVGEFQKIKKYGFVILDGNKSNHDIFIPTEHINGAKNHDKVVVEILFFDRKDKNPTGRVVEVLGNTNDTGIQILAIAKTYELPDEFSYDTLNYARSLPDVPDKKDFANREDFRDLFTVTIDGADAKDFDDAISIEKKDDKYILYVHIADVAHYVTENSAINDDAYERGNSVYLLDRVIPMLPEELSNSLCSLNPNVDRLTVTVKMVFDKKGNINDYYFYESIIRSNYRLVYENVSDLLEGKENIYKDDELIESLSNMNELHAILEEKRKIKGALDFDFKESKIILDKYGTPIDIKEDERRVANKLIESFMVVTNEVVGGHFANMDVPFIYRVHEAPSEDKVEEFRSVIAKFGLQIKGQQLYPKDFQKILEDVEGTTLSFLISNIMLRTMRKAEYKREPNIHFGLATENYSHFTAPIRRYSDLVVHRILKGSLHNNFKKEKRSYLKRLDKIAAHISETERNAEEAERDVESLKKAEYMQNKIGNIYDGIISSITNFGIFVELPNTVEGLVHFRSLNDDYYEFDKENYKIIGQHLGKVYELGQQVTIKVDNVNIDAREIDFKLMEVEEKEN
ncbi:ribonuclease R [Helcococcus kunzii]|uniref:Ribonuclease R n=1 Tax=Helcococcus kunzii ATCC 51366 TaxID=883114 RepID=H3NMW3_9FIRM|nr:ribonuclease R [Helcococcus kunzii]EHR34704.1 ribonuclease R [Helcococcus kunzii ATCC 51366]MCT1795358.1 ribonuclease R [Helcococcus kunzii]MCT1989539.1 ribonuclease R [Helcococcus kunzii]QZO77029.1 ribonuclease R [Helcococcus kunzii]